MSEAKIKNNRYQWVDVLRGYCIIFVILGHMDNEIGGLKYFLYSFHLPAFFILSGYLFNANKYSFWEFVKRKAKGLLIPFFLMGTFICVENWMFYHMGEWDELLNYFIELILEVRFHTIWYLTCLFLTEIVFYILVKYVVHDQLFLLGMITIIMAAVGIFYYAVGGQPLIWNADICLVAIFFMFVGYAVKDVELKGNVFAFLVAIALNISGVIINWRLTGTGLEMFGGEYACIPVTLIASLAGTYMVYWLSERKLFKGISFIGRYSMVYFGLHQAGSIPLAEIIYGQMGIFTSRVTLAERIGYVVCTLMITLISCTLVQYLIFGIKKGWKSIYKPVVQK